MCRESSLATFVVAATTTTIVMSAVDTKRFKVLNLPDLEYQT
jgi:hypothetical protein